MAIIREIYKFQKKIYRNFAVKTKYHELLNRN